MFGDNDGLASRFWDRWHWSLSLASPRSTALLLLFSLMMFNHSGSCFRMVGGQGHTTLVTYFSMFDTCMSFQSAGSGLAEGPR